MTESTLMFSLPFTSVTTALLALLMLPLTLSVSMRRLALGREKGDVTAFVFGDGNDLTLKRRTRAFGNLIEYVPTCVVLLFLTEVGGASTTLLWVNSTLLVAGRVLHALGMLYVNSPAPRGLAMLMTYVTLLGPACWLLSRLWL
jgi:uncharacterized membrane protein YecN with MAPEG domain